MALPGLAAKRRQDIAWIVAIPIVCWIVLAGAALLGPRFDYNLWDNFEYFSPIINYAHGLWLDGQVPLWNPHQHLGEPILAAGQPGALYAPYTLAVLLVRMLGLDPAQLMLVIVLIHVPLAALGWFCLMRRLDVRPSLAMVGSMGASFGGFVTSVTSVWVFMLAVFVWLPWILYGMVRQFRDGGLSGGIPFVGGLVATACIGHPQMLVYQWLVAGLFSLGLGLLVFRQPLRLARIGLFFAMATALSLPALLPMREMLSLSVRANAFTLAEFLERGVEPQALAGWLLPYFKAANGFLPDRASVMAFQGAWVMPAVFGGMVVSWRSLRASGNPAGQGAPIARAFWVSLAVSGLLLFFALGGGTPFYRLTYGIPIWSSMRWPFKFFLFSQATLLLAAVLGLELWARQLKEARLPRWLPAALFLAIAALAAWRLDLVPLGGRVELLGLFAALLTLVGFSTLDRGRLATSLLLSGVIAGAVALTANAHDRTVKVYLEKYGKTGAQQLGITRDYRVLPLTGQAEDRPLMQPLALLHAATANGYHSATGTSAGLIPEWFEETLPVNVLGVPPGQLLGSFLPSNLLRSFNIGYLVLSVGDRQVRRLVEETGGFTLVREDEDSVTYATKGALPRAYFASRTYHYTTEGFRQGMLLNGAPADAAYVEGWNGPELGATGRVVAAKWGADRSVLEVEAPRGGFLVLSMSYYPGWDCAVDGRQVRLERVNRRLMGVALPAGARRVVLEFRPASLRSGIILLFCTALPLGLALLFAPRILARLKKSASERKNLVF